METHGPDHDDGVEGMSTEKSTVIRKKGQYLGGIPAAVHFQLQKDKTSFSVQVYFTSTLLERLQQNMMPVTCQGDMGASVYHSGRAVSTVSGEAASLGADMMYTGRLETQLKVLPFNATTLGGIVSTLVEEGARPHKARTGFSDPHLCV